MPLDSCSLHVSTTDWTCPRCRRVRMIDDVVRWTRRLGRFELFGTLTLNPTRLLSTRRSAETLERRFREWLRRCTEHLKGRLIKAIGAIEFHRNGLAHGHFILGIEGGVKRGDTAKMKRLWTPSGHTDLKRARSTRDATAYLSKHLYESDDNVLIFWPEKGLTPKQLRAIA